MERNKNINSKKEIVVYPPNTILKVQVLRYFLTPVNETSVQVKKQGFLLWRGEMFAAHKTLFAKASVLQILSKLKDSEALLYLLHSF